MRGHMALRDDVKALTGDVEDLAARVAALEASIRGLLAPQASTLGGVSSAYSEKEAKEAKAAADKYVERRKHELFEYLFAEEASL